MAFKVQIVLDSVSPRGHRLLTYRVEYPREILPEILTHTSLSRNTSSSRAIPSAVLIDRCRRDPYVPPHLGRNERGMQANEELPPDLRAAAEHEWRSAARGAADHAEALAALGTHKQVANRVTEPYGWTRQVLTGTAWANFFALRCHEAAHPSFRLLARAMYIAFRRSVPQPLGYGQWHLPFIRPDDQFPAAALVSRELLDAAPPDWPQHGSLEDLLLARWSAARCARVSYGNVDGTPPTPAKDDETFRRLCVRAPGDTEPLHASPLGHQATPFHPAWEASHPHLRSNLQGWLQFRKLIPNENVTAYEPSAAEVASWQVPEEMFGWGEEVWTLPKKD